MELSAFNVKITVLGGLTTIHAINWSLIKIVNIKEFFLFVIYNNLFCKNAKYLN